MKFDYLLKFVIIGDSNAGKSNILSYYAFGKFKEKYKSPIGCDFGVRKIEIKNKIYRLQIWDTAGQEKFRFITRVYYKNSVCTIIVYNIADRNSFNSIPSWIEDCKKESPKTITMVFYNTTYEISKKIEEGYYDLNDSNSVIKCWNKENDIILNKPQKNSNCMIV